MPAHELLRAFLITAGIVAILIGMFAPERVQAFTAAWVAAP
jgi:hypothetical protein